jgi:hypothetical protein
MLDIDKKTRTNRLQLTDKKARQPLEPLRTGMPALDSIHDDSVTFKAKGRTYRILKTTEVDSYENTPTALALRKVLHGVPQPAPSAIAAAAKLSTSKKPSGKKPAPSTSADDFAGTARKIAKLSIPAAPVENFKDVSKLIASLPSVSTMVALNISTAPNSDRVQQEKRNIHVSGFLFAASREADNDFHLIVGLDPNATQEMYMTMEVSGLPPSASPAFGPLDTTRTAYKNFFGTQNLPGAGYHFYQPPIPVQIDGSLFFDANHSIGQAPGPPSLKSRMPTIWEVHPISKIVLGP